MEWSGTMRTMTPQHSTSTNVGDTGAVIKLGPVVWVLLGEMFNNKDPGHRAGRRGGRAVDRQLADLVDLPGPGRHRARVRVLALLALIFVA